MKHHTTTVENTLFSRAHSVATKILQVLGYKTESDHNGKKLKIQKNIFRKSQMFGN
jgi:hypothetical protein